MMLDVSCRDISERQKKYDIGRISELTWGCFVSIMDTLLFTMSGIMGHSPQTT